MHEFHGRAKRTVPSSVEDVFALITDVDRLPEWNRAIERVVTRPDHLAPGSRWQVTMHPPRVPRWGSVSTVLENDGRTRFRYETRNADGNPSYSLWDWRLTPADGGTEVEVSWEVHLLTRDRQLLAGPIRRRQLAREVPGSLERLAALQSSPRSRA